MDRIVVLYDNTAAADRMVPGWGFAAWIEHAGRRVLFDTGADRIVLDANARAAGIDLADVEAVCLSHPHGDHTGGLTPRLRDGAPIHLLGSFGRGFIDKIRRRGARPVVASAAESVTETIMVTGPVRGAVEEQAVVVRTGNGLVLITGCAHPGIDKMTDAVVRAFGEPPELAVGGFHLWETGDDEVRAVAAALRDGGIRRIGPCHCTGPRAIEIFRDVFGDRFVRVGVGTVIPLTGAPAVASG